MRTGLVRSAAAMALAASVMLHGGTAHAQRVFSASGGFPAIAIKGNTIVARLRIPPGSYVVSGNGIVRNDDGTSTGHVECALDTNSGSAGALVDMLVPTALSPGVPGGATWSFSTTLTNATASPTRLRVKCLNFGPVDDSKVTGSFWNLVAVPVSQVRHTDHP